MFHFSRGEGRKGIWQGREDSKAGRLQLATTHYLSTVGSCRFRQNPSRHHPSVLSIAALSLSVSSLLFEPSAGRPSGFSLARYVSLPRACAVRPPNPPRPNSRSSPHTAYDSARLSAKNSLATEVIQIQKRIRLWRGREGQRETICSEELATKCAEGKAWHVCVPVAAMTCSLFASLHEHRVIFPWFECSFLLVPACSWLRKLYAWAKQVWESEMKKRSNRERRGRDLTPRF